MYEKCPEIQIRLCIKYEKFWLCYTTSWCVGTGKECRKLPWCLGKLLESLFRFELHSMCVFNCQLFHKKSKFCIQVWAQLSGLWALGLSSAYVCQWIRVKSWAKRSMHWWKKYLIFLHLFSNLFHVILIPIMANLSNFGMHEILSIQWVITLHKKIQMYWFSIFFHILFN